MAVVGHTYAMPSTPYRWVRPLAVLAIGFVVTTAFQAHPAPGAHGQHLAVTVALVGIAAGTVGMLRLANPTSAVLMLLLVVIVVGAAVLVGLQPSGPGFLAVFPAVSGAALRLPTRFSTALTTIGVVALAVAWAIGGHRSLAGVVLNEFGVIAFYVISMFARRLRESNEQAQRLIAELEASRAAQAQAAVLGERQRLAREMHDVLAHSLSGLVLNLEGARLLAERDGTDPQMTQAIQRAHRLAKTGLEEARRAIGMLRDDELPGPERLAGLASDFEEDSGVACSFVVVGVQRELGTDGRLTFYRVAQEALTNIRKHSCPQRVELSLAYEPAGTRLTIEDFEVRAPASPSGDSTGYGLTGMRERAELLGGTLGAEPTTHGFRVELWVPV